MSCSSNSNSQEISQFCQQMCEGASSGQCCYTQPQQGSGSCNTSTSTRCSASDVTCTITVTIPNIPIQCNYQNCQAYQQCYNQCCVNPPPPPCYSGCPNFCPGNLPPNGGQNNKQCLTQTCQEVEVNAYFCQDCIPQIQITNKQVNGTCYCGKVTLNGSFDVQVENFTCSCQASCQQETQCVCYPKQIGGGVNGFPPPGQISQNSQSSNQIQKFVQDVCKASTVDPCCTITITIQCTLSANFKTGQCETNNPNCCSGVFEGGTISCSVVSYQINCTPCGAYQECVNEFG